MVRPLRWLLHFSGATHVVAAAGRCEAAFVATARRLCGRCGGGGGSALRGVVRRGGVGEALVRPPWWRRPVSVAEAVVGAAGP